MPGDVAERLAIPHYVLDYEERFRRAVIEDFAETYAKGQTPIPCVRCNERIKFGDLLTLARELGADALATGHYVRRRLVNTGRSCTARRCFARPELLPVRDDRSAACEVLRFPLGGLTKQEVRAVARSLDLSIADKPDSQDICFVPQGRYSDVVERLKPEAAEPGEIVDASGRVLGHHPGIIHFTVGQRKGLGLVGNRRTPVRASDWTRRSRRVIVGPREALRTRIVKLASVNWLTDTDAGSMSCAVKVRSTRSPVPAVVTPLPGASARRSNCSRGRRRSRPARPASSMRKAERAFWAAVGSSVRRRPRTDAEVLPGFAWLDRPGPASYIAPLSSSGSVAQW